MFSEVKNLLMKEEIDEQDLTEMAAYLLKKQFIFRDQTGDKKAFTFIHQHFSVFEKALAFFGGRLELDAEYGYIGYIPKHNISTAKITETSALLTLRIIYHEERIAGNAVSGVVIISGQVLADEYRKQTGRNELGETKGAFDDIMRPIAQKSIIRFGDVDPETDMRDIHIMPCIERLVTPEFAESLSNEIYANKQRPGNDLSREEGTEEDLLDEA